MGEYSNIKPSYDTNRQLLGEVFPIDTPFTVILDSSEVCNFRCNYCFRSDSNKTSWSYAARQDLMDWDVFLKAFDQVMEFPHDVKQISVSHQGEPLVNKRLPLMVKHMRDNGYNGRISMHTNGSLLNEEYAIQIGEAGFSRIVISIQGINAKNYEKTCGFKIDYDSFINNIETLYKAKKDKKWGTQICVKIADEALEGGTKEEFYQLFQDISDRMFVETVVPIWKNMGEPIKYGGDDDFVVSKFGNTFPRQRCCRILFDTVVVLPKGDIYPCTQLLGPKCMGNINDTSLVEYWNCESRRNLMRDVLLLNTPDMCEGCYILQNSIYTQEDMIDNYRYDILNRLDSNS